MRQILFVIAVLSCTSAMAANADSTLHRHAFSISMANGVSQQFFNGPTHNTSNTWYTTYPTWGPPFPAIISHQSLPMYTVHVQLHYSLGISAQLRLETGIGYLLSGTMENQAMQNIPNDILHGYFYYGAVTLPLYLKLTKPMKRGAYTCTLGPDFTMPVHFFYYNNSWTLGGETLSSTNHHTRYTTSVTAQESSMGLYLKMGYEKQIKGPRPVSINIGPVIDFFELVNFHNVPGEFNDYSSFGYYRYQFYAGLDVALTFGFKK